MLQKLAVILEGKQKSKLKTYCLKAEDFLLQAAPARWRHRLHQLQAIC